MFGFAIPAEAQPWVALSILVVMFVLFVMERAPVEVTAIGGATLMLVLGILPLKEATSVLSNPAPWTIAMMFLVMAKPKPVPELLVVKYGANTFSRASSGIPAPLSRISSRILFPTSVFSNMATSPALSSGIA